MAEMWDMTIKKREGAEKERERRGDREKERGPIQVGPVLTCCPGTLIMEAWPAAAGLSPFRLFFTF